MRAGCPAETNPPLVVDANAVLSSPSAFQRFQPVARRHRHIRQLCRRIQLQQLAPRGPLNVGRQAPRRLRAKYLFGLRAGEALNHFAMNNNV